MIVFAPYPIPVVVENDKDGYVLYIDSMGMYENDVWCVVHCNGGVVRHYTTDQIRIYQNSTFQINKNDKKESSS